MIRLLLAATVLAPLFVAPALSAGKSNASHSFILPSDDGYGLADCVSAGPGSSCGQVIADAWCKTQGHGAAVAFGRSDAMEFTGSIGNTKIAQAGALVVTCGN